jgi:uncharacterized protein, YigZ family
MLLLTIQKDIQHEIIIEKSRFLCTLKKVDNEIEAQTHIKALKKQYWDATHNCSAYIIGENMEYQKSSDDGEPSGTAGIPMLEILRKKGLHNVLAIVTRYFGGIKLGAGGLIRAYGKSVSETIQQAGIAQKELLTLAAFSEPPQDAGKILNLLYTHQTTFLLQMKSHHKPQIETRLQELLGKPITLTTREEKYIEIPYHREN